MEKKDKGDRVYLNVPYEEKEAAKKLGARWDQGTKKWYVPPTLPRDLSENVRQMFELWGEGREGVRVSDEGRGLVENQTRQTYQKINHVLDVWPVDKQGGPNQILQLRVKKLCIQFLAGNKSQSSHMDLVMYNCELTNLLYCMLLQNEYLQSQVQGLHTKWINEAQCNWKKL
jgi:hypothetical protein